MFFLSLRRSLSRAEAVIHFLLYVCVNTLHKLVTYFAKKMVDVNMMAFSQTAFTEEASLLASSFQIKVIGLSIVG